MKCKDKFMKTTKHEGYFKYSHCEIHPSTIFVIAVFNATRLTRVGFTSDDFVTNDVFIFVFFRVIDCRHEQPSVNGRLINQDTIFLVVTSMCHNRNMNLRPRWNIVQMDEEGIKNYMETLK